MIGVYDFCGHYEWTFDWLEREGGHALVRAYWGEAIHRDSQLHARELILRDGFAAVHVPECEPVVDFTQRLELYTETCLGYTVSTNDFVAACRAAAEVTA